MSQSCVRSKHSRRECLTMQYFPIQKGFAAPLHVERSKFISSPQLCYHAIFPALYWKLQHDMCSWANFMSAFCIYNKYETTLRHHTWCLLWCLPSKMKQDSIVCNLLPTFDWCAALLEWHMLRNGSSQITICTLSSNAARVKSLSQQQVPSGYHTDTFPHSQ